jgi:hypothetical protein
MKPVFEDAVPQNEDFGWEYNLKTQFAKIGSL